MEKTTASRAFEYRQHSMLQNMMCPIVNYQMNLFQFSFYHGCFICSSLQRLNQQLYNMSEERPALLIQLQKCVSRRSRKDEEGRDFQCGCGKRYLSYPALYTHIKTKHDGKQPEGTLKTGNSMVIKKIKAKSQEETLKGIYNNLQMEDIRLLKQTADDFRGQVPITSRIKKELLPKQIWQCYIYLMKHQEYSLTKQSSLDQALTIYLLNVGQFVNEKLYDYYVIFSKLVRSCFVKYGQEIKAKCFNNKESEKYIQSFSLNNLRYFPIICDFFLRYFIQYDELAAEHKNINKSMIELMLFDFCDWLLKKKCTLVRCNLNKEYKHFIKPNPLVKKTNNTEEHALQEQNKIERQDGDVEQNVELQGQMQSKGEQKMVMEQNEQQKQMVLQPIIADDIFPCLKVEDIIQQQVKQLAAEAMAAQNMNSELVGQKQSKQCNQGS